MSDFVKYVVKLLGKGCPLWASVGNGLLVPLGARTTRHVNKGYVCMYVYERMTKSVPLTGPSR